MCKLLSRSGKAQLIRSVLNNLPTYYLSVFKMPNRVAKKIIQMEKRFFWGSDENQPKLAFVRWDILEAPIDLGGLGLGSVQIKNLGLLSKWWWKWSAVDSPLWKKIVRSINSYYKPFLSIHEPLHGPLEDVVTEMHKLPWFNDLLFNSFKLQPGDGENIQF